MRCTIPGDGKKSYPIIIADDGIMQLPELLSALPDIDGIFAVYDKAVEGIAKRVQNLTQCQMIAVSSGEASKNLAQVERIAEDLLLKGANKQSVVLIIGGGMVCDLGGFAASIFRRGVRSIQIPTNIIGMVDAGIGGHTGIDIGQVKNVIGSNAYPSGIIIDTTVISGLQDEHLRDGIVEVIKLAAMCDAEFFGWLEEHINQILDRDSSTITNFISHAVRLKVDILEKGEENTCRLFTTFGHTIGHALESLSHFKLSHGEAVAIGMITESRVHCGTSCDRIAKLLEHINMPTTIPADISESAIWDVIKTDYKVSKGQVRIAVPTDIGSGTLRTMTFNDVTQAA